MGKSTISMAHMAIFNSFFVCLPGRVEGRCKGQDSRTTKVSDRCLAHLKNSAQAMPLMDLQKV